MGELFQPWHLAILAIIAVLLFGGKKLPELGKGLGEGWRGFKEGISGLGDDAKKTTDAAKTTDSANTVTPKPGDDIKPPTA